MKIQIAVAIPDQGEKQEVQLAEYAGDFLRREGHTVDFVLLPFVRDALGAPEQLYAYRSFDIGRQADLLITVGYPAFLLRHPNKVAFLYSLFPEMHECYGTALGVPDIPQYQKLRKALDESERLGLRETKQVYCASPQLKSDVAVAGGVIGKTFFYVGELTAGEEICCEEPYIVLQSAAFPQERTELVIDALCEIGSGCKAAVFLPGCDPLDKKALEQRAARLGVSDRLLLFDRSATAREIEGATAAVSPVYQARCTPDWVASALCAGVPVVACVDGGAVPEGAAVVPAQAGAIARAAGAAVTQSGGQKPHKEYYEAMRTGIDELLRGIVNQ